MFENKDKNTTKFFMTVKIITKKITFGAKFI